MRAVNYRASTQRAQGVPSSQPSRPTAAINRAAAAGFVSSRVGAFPARYFSASRFSPRLESRGAAASFPSFQRARGAASAAVDETPTANRPRFIPAGDFHCGVEQSGQLAGLITRKSLVRIQPPLVDSPQR